MFFFFFFFFFQAEDGIRDLYVTGVQTCALPISSSTRTSSPSSTTSSAPTSTSKPSPTSPATTRRRSGWTSACAPSPTRTSGSTTSTSRSPSPPARRCGPRSRPSSPASGSKTSTPVPASSCAAGSPTRPATTRSASRHLLGDAVDVAAAEKDLARRHADHLALGENPPQDRRCLLIVPRDQQRHHDARVAEVEV